MSQYVSQQPSRPAVELEAGPIKLKGVDSPITYIVVGGFILLAALYIYAKYLHKPVSRILRRKKK